MKHPLCIIGRHAGQEDGGTMMFTCPRCKGSFWQPHDYSAVTSAADRLIDQGDHEGAERLVRSAFRGQGR